MVLRVTAILVILLMLAACGKVAVSTFSGCDRKSAGYDAGADSLLAVTDSDSGPYTLGSDAIAGVHQPPGGRPDPRLPI